MQRKVQLYDSRLEGRNEVLKELLDADFPTVIVDADHIPMTKVLMESIEKDRIQTEIYTKRQLFFDIIKTFSLIVIAICFVIFLFKENISLG